MADASAYYLLALPEPADGRFHPIEVRVKRAGALVRSRRGFFAGAPGGEAADRRASGAGPGAGARRGLPPLARRTSALIRPWFGQSRGDDGRTRVTFSWEPAPRPAVQSGRPPAVPARIEVKALNGDGDTIFTGAVRPAGAATVVDASAGGSAGEPSRIAFDIAPGLVRIELSIHDVQHRPIDVDVRDMRIVGLTGAVALGTAEVFRTRNAREHRAVADDPAAAPTAAREFNRAERLLIRVPIYGGEGMPPVVTARLISRLGSVMREAAIEPGPGDNLYDVDVPLAGLASGEYRVEITAAANGQTATDRVSFRVTP
jgi:hypothetical protein